MLKAISLWQPWASLMAQGIKHFETRGRLTHIRGLVAIHAARQHGYPSISFAEFCLQTLGTMDLPLGKVLAVGELWDCWKTEHVTSLREPISAAALSAAELQCGNYEAGRFVWPFRNMVRLKEPVECKGRQGFFNLPPEVEAKVRAQL
jgi:hypothetical protein